MVFSEIINRGDTLVLVLKMLFLGYVSESGDFEGLRFGYLIRVKYCVTFLMIRRVYSCLVLFLGPLSFSVLQRNGGLLG